MMKWRMVMLMGGFLFACWLPAHAFRPEITPGLAPVLAPIQHQRYFLHERELFGYNPRFAVSTVQFSAGNHPWLRTKTTVQTLDGQGNWIQKDFCQALYNACPGWDGLFASEAPYQDSRIVFDDDNDAYMLVNLSGYGYQLMHSKDLCQTWSVYPLDSTTVVARMEFRDGHNQLQRPPVILRRATREGMSSSLNLIVVSKKPNGTLSLTDKLIPIAQSIVGGGLNIPKGESNLSVTLGNKTHFVYAGRYTVNGDVGTPQFAQTYNHLTGTFSAGVYLGSAGVGSPDEHNWPGICLDSQGYLHVVLGAHGGASGQCFKYTRSLVPDSTTGGWTPLENLVSGLTYLSLLCDQDDTLHLVARNHWDPEQKLKYQRKKAGQPWETRKTLVIPFNENPGGNARYAHYHQNLNLDQQGRLFVIYYITRMIEASYPAMADAYRAKWPCDSFVYGDGVPDRPAMLISDDGGDTWRLAVTDDFVNGLLN